MPFCEVILSTEIKDATEHIFLYDLKSGGRLCRIGTEGTVANGISCIHDEVIVYSNRNKPILHFWHIYGKKLPLDKVILPGKPSAVCISVSGFCAVSIGSNIFVWELSSGCLVATLSHHYQPIKVLRWSSDGSFLISGADDGMICVYGLDNILDTSIRESSSKRPMHILTYHTSPIAGLHISADPCRPLLFSASMDKTCRAFCLTSGVLLTSINFDVPLYSVVADSGNCVLYCGGHTEVFIINLSALPFTKEFHFQRNIDNIFIGHENPIQCLALTSAGDHLCSGSDDGSIRIFDVLTRVCLTVIQHSSPITNLLLVRWDSSTDTRERNLLPIIRPFQRQASNMANYCVTVRIASTEEERNRNQLDF